MSVSVLLLKAMVEVKKTNVPIVLWAAYGLGLLLYVEGRKAIDDLERIRHLELPL